MRASLLKKSLLSIVLVFLTICNIGAQTFVKQINGAGNTEPRIFKSTVSTDYFITASTGNSTYITQVNAAGTMITTHELKFTGDVAVIRDMVIDWVDGTLAGIAIGNNRNYIFKYDFFSASFNWLTAYPTSYVFQNIHQVNAVNYVVTGEILRGGTTIFEVMRASGAMGYQNAGFVGEFFSTFDGTDIYGACRYYTSGSTFNPSVYQYNVASGTNTWTSTYIVNAGTVRIYPVAPCVDGPDIVTLNSGDATAAFNTYLSGPTDAWLFKTDLAGNLAWTKKITIPGYPRLNAKRILNTATGYYLIIDSYDGVAAQEDFFFIIKTDKGGNLQWAKRYGITGKNSAISAVEDNGDLRVTVTSSSYAPGNNTLFLKLDPNGMANTTCGYITSANVNIININNNQQPKPVSNTPTAYSNNPHTATINNVTPTEKIYCSGTGGGGGILPCQTLSGSLASGVLAFYPFGYGSLLDLSGNGYDLTNPTTAFPTMDRSSNPTCAYHFNKVNGDFLTPLGSSSFIDNITTSAFSISLWYQPTGTRPVGDYELLIGRGNSGLHCPDTWSEWSVGLYDCRKAVVGFDQYSHWESPVTPNCAAMLAAISNNWHHLAFVYDGTSNYDLYIDGVWYANSHGPCGPMSANIGAMMLGVDYTGDLDDIIIYNRAISAAEVGALMALNGSCCDGVSSSFKSTNTSTLVKGHEGITIYPNPAEDQVSVSAVKSIIRSVSIYSNTGALQGTYQFNKSNASVDIKHLASGVYFIKVITDAGSTTEKLIKN